VLTELRRGAPARNTGAPSWWLVGFAGLVLLLTILDVEHHGWLWHFDRTVSRQMLDWDLRDNHGAESFLSVLTRFGNRFHVLVVSVPVMLYLTWRARRSEYLLRFVLALIVLTVAVYALKFTVTRYPPVVYTDRPNRSISFPSGHMANAILVWSLVAWSAVRAGAPLLLTRTLQTLRVVAPLAVLVGMTLLDYHWISDFIGGACVGVILLSIVLLPVWSDLGAWVDRLVPERFRSTGVR
jgi:membrane-associated phospholipid phosphatase